MAFLPGIDSRQHFARKWFRMGRSMAIGLLGLRIF